MLEPLLPNAGLEPWEVSKEDQVLITLRYLATDSHQTVITDVSDVIGCVDDCHIRIQRHINFGNHYYCRRACCVVNMTAVVDARARFMYTNCGLAGRHHENGISSRIWQHSEAAAEFDEGRACPGYRLLGMPALPTPASEAPESSEGLRHSLQHRHLPRNAKRTVDVPHSSRLDDPSPEQRPCPRIRHRELLNGHRCDGHDKDAMKFVTFFLACMHVCNNFALHCVLQHELRRPDVEFGHMQHVAPCDMLRQSVARYVMPYVVTCNMFSHATSCCPTYCHQQVVSYNMLPHAHVTCKMLAETM
ncbi:unnamed protein product [Cylicocyclus nassatus]|uniref:Uncharacterized protein n=1 Tax=Cylicocyclus nassatus TaxID=53992 RepID=A0AA36DQ89_CYLNA|nr:unnamed protein product [Cylicocyclus nassatus]